MKKCRNKIQSVIKDTNKFLIKHPHSVSILMMSTTLVLALGVSVRPSTIRAKTYEDVPTGINLSKSIQIVSEVTKVIDDTVANSKKKIEESKKVEKPTKTEKPKKKTVSNSYRMTSYTSEIEGTSLGSGVKFNQLRINDKGWYTYQGKLVVATATRELLNTGFAGYNPNIKYFSYGDTFTLIIDGVSYQAIVLDSCGASMNFQSSDAGNGRIDLYVNTVSNRVDRGYLGKNPVQVVYE